MDGIENFINLTVYVFLFGLTLLCSFSFFFMIKCFKSDELFDKVGGLIFPWFIVTVIGFAVTFEIHRNYSIYMYEKQQKLEKQEQLKEPVNEQEIIND